MTLTTSFQKSDRHAQLVWFDPGATTGVCALAVRPSWLEGTGDPSPAGLRKAITALWMGQTGRKARVVDAGGRTKPSERVVRRPEGAARLPENLTTLTAEEFEMVNECEAVLDLWLDAAWGYEGFVPTPGLVLTADALTPVKVFARLEYVEVLYGERQRVPFVQSASTAKTTATDPRLSAAGLYQPGMPHACDAARHALTFLRRARQDIELRRSAWPKLFKAAAA